MSNQTIDGVPRAVIAAFAKVADSYSEAEDDSYEPWQDAMMHAELRLTLGQFRELRALLDAPAPRAEFKKVEMAHVMNALEDVRGKPVLTSNQCHDLARALNDRLLSPLQLLAMPAEYLAAAQPQGEPVAWRWMQANKKEWEYGSKLPVCVIGTWASLYAEQPAPVAVVMSFDFEHPFSKEKRTVALSKQDVFNGMKDYFYDKLGEQICHCESVGETNVVDCSCDEYVHDFEIVKTSLTS